MNALVIRTETEIKNSLHGVHTHGGTKVNLDQLVDGISTRELFEELEGYALTTKEIVETRITYKRTPTNSALGKLLAPNGNSVVVPVANIQAVMADPDFMAAVELITTRREAAKFGVSVEIYLAIKGAK